MANPLQPTSCTAAWSVGIVLLMLAAIGSVHGGTRATVLDQDVLIRDVRGTGARAEASPDVVFNPVDNRYLVVYDVDDGGTDHDIRGLFVGGDGQPLGSPFDIMVNAGVDDRYPVVAYGWAGNDYLVVWQRHLGDGSVDICGRIVAPPGLPGVVYNYTSAYGGDQINPDVGYVLGPDRYLVVWEDHDPALSAPPDVFGKAVDSSGAPLFELNVGIGSDSQTSPALAAKTWDSTLLVAFTDGRGNPDGIRARAVDIEGTGSLIGSELVLADTASYPGAPAVSWAVNTEPPPHPGEFLVVWAAGGVVYGRRVTAHDYLVASAAYVISDYSSSKDAPAVAHHAVENEWWVAWPDNRDYG